MVSDTLIQKQTKDRPSNFVSRSVQSLRLAHSKAQHSAWIDTLSTFDDLTGLANRRGLLEALSRELDRVVRGHAQNGLLLNIELENLNAIRNAYGVKAADSALRLLADTLKSNTRNMDLAARTSGADFAILLANADALSTAGRAQNLSLTLNSLRLRFQGHTIPLHASLSMHPYTARDNAQALLQKQDKPEHVINMEREELTRAILNAAI